MFSLRNNKNYLGLILHTSSYGALNYLNMKRQTVRNLMNGLYLEIFKSIM